MPPKKKPEFEICKVEIDVQCPSTWTWVRYKDQQYSIKNSSAVRIENPPDLPPEYPAPGMIVLVKWSQECRHSIETGVWLVKRLVEFVPPLISRERGQRHIVIDLESLEPIQGERTGVLIDHLLPWMQWDSKPE